MPRLNVANGGRIRNAGKRCMFHVEQQRVDPPNVFHVEQKGNSFGSDEVEPDNLPLCR